jgi:hypothetical protein
MLVEAAISFGGRNLRDAKKLVERVSVNHGLEFADVPRHRAEADARRLAFAVTQATTDHHEGRQQIPDGANSPPKCGDCPPPLRVLTLP